MDKYSYLDVIPKIRVYEKNLIDNSIMDRMLSSNNIDELLRFLSETTYSRNVDGDITPFNYEKVLTTELDSLFTDMNSVLKNNNLINIFTLKYLYNNLKIMLKSKLLDVDSSNLTFEFNVINNLGIYEAVYNENYKYLEERISSIIKLLMNNFNDNKDLSEIDIMLDKFMFEDLKKKSREIGDSFIISYIDKLIDIFNVKALFRIKKLGLDKKILDRVICVSGNIDLERIKSLFIEINDNLLIKFSSIYIYKYIKSGIEKFIDNNEVSLLDIELDNYLMNFLKKGKIFTSGLSPIVGYINAKEMEVRNLRLIIMSKINNIPSEVIRGRLVVNYV